MSACRDCEWFTANEPFSPDAHMKPTGLCHYNPPTYPGFPVVYETDFCTGYQQKSEAQQ